MLAVPKSTTMSGRRRLEGWAAIVDWRVENCVLNFTPRLTSAEMPVETRVPCESIEDVPRSITVSCERQVEAPVETTVAMLVPEEIADDTAVAADFTEEIPRVVVDNDPEKMTQMLFSVETLACVEVAVVFDWAVERRVAIDVTDDIKVDSDVVADRAAL